MLTADFIAINKYEVTSGVAPSVFTQCEARAKRSHTQNKQWYNHPYHFPCSASLRTHRHQSNSKKFICLNMWVNIIVLALKSVPQIAAKTGNPAVLLFRRIWYSVGKSGVLGITEYRQGRPLVMIWNSTWYLVHCLHHSVTALCVLCMYVYV